MNVVASTFGSRAWAGMLPHARALADVLQAQLTVVHIDPAGRGAASQSPDFDAGASILDAVRGIEPGAGVQVIPGSTGEGGIVANIARAADAAVVAMHAEPGGPVTELMGNGRIPRILEGANVPVLLGSGVLEPPRLPYRLLIAADDSGDAERSIQVVTDLLASIRVPIGIVTAYFDVLGDGPVDAEADARRDRLETLAKQLPAGIEVDLMVERGTGLETIQSQVLAAAERWRASAIVVAHQRRGRLLQALTGSTSLAILRKSPVPLLFAPASRPRPAPRAVGRAEVDVDLPVWRTASLRGLVPRQRRSGFGL